tara:strand:+ start:441 stop:1838 length:1398 start_codon:yes stop_codon:yes gene_type:complete
MNKLFSQIDKYKNEIAIIAPDKKNYSYKEICKFSKKINSLVPYKSLVLVISNNSASSIIGYVALMKTNNLILLLDEKFKFDFIEKTIKNFKPNYIFAPNLFFKKIKKVKKILNFEDFSLFKTKNTQHKKVNNINKLLISTSGSTQSPKFVRISEKNISTNTESIKRYLKINSKQVTITTMPMAYSYGLSIINTHINCGCKIVVTNKTVFEKDFWNIIKRYKVNSFGGVPQFYEQLKRIRFENFDLSSLQYLTQAGGKLDKSYLEYFKKISKNYKIKFVIMYGQAEASPRMSYLPWNYFSKKSESIGKAIKDSKFELINEKNKKIKKPFETGEIIYHGNNVSLGYGYNIKDLFKGDFNKGKLFTGDLAYKDKEGFYYIVGRKNRISKIFGIRIDLDEIEKNLKKKGFKVKCLPDNKYLKIISNNNYQVNKLKKIIKDFSGIRENYIIFKTNKKIENINNFKNINIA